MGLLTDPRAGTGRLIKLLLKWEKSLSVLLYLVGIGWMMLLALPTFNDATYFSENALLPGLLTKESNLEQTSKQFYHELVHEMKRFPDKMPYAWLSAKFNQLHLDVFTHNFSLVYPLQEQKFTGQNIYGIVRAPRAASTEAIVVSVPFRPINSIYADTAPSVALLLAFAKFCRKQKYWAKDIIFLVTEHEQLGMQAWLDAYHGVVSGHEGVLIPGDLAGRAGSIQAAINLELHAMKIASIDVKVEGLNGQLPNLDLFNLAQNMIVKEGIRQSFQRRFDVSHGKNNYKTWTYQFTTLMSMISTQATGIPTGNHGLFHRFGIEAITLEGFERNGPGPESSFYYVGRVVESIVRSLNNLLERFHQSFFFYLLPSTDRYISIGLYMRPLAAIIVGLFLKAFCMWQRLQTLSIRDGNKDEKQNEDNAKDKSVEDNKKVKSVEESKKVKSTEESKKVKSTEENKKVKPTEDSKKRKLSNDNKKGKQSEENKKENQIERSELEKAEEAEKHKFDIGSIASEILWAHLFGALVMSSPKFFTSVGKQFWNLRTEDSVYIGFVTTAILMLMWPLFSRRSVPYNNISLVCVIASVELATTLMCVAMHNFSLALLAAVAYVPLVLLISPKSDKTSRWRVILNILWILVHPFVASSVVITAFTFINFREEPILSILFRGYRATKQAFIFSIVDSMIYGNWFYNVTTAVMLPIWSLFWNIICSNTVINT